jgi:uncharacterized protein YjdB
LITSVAKNSGNYRLKAVWKPKYNIFIPDYFAATDDSDNDITFATEGQTVTITYSGPKYVQKIEIFPMPKSVSIDQTSPLSLSVNGTETLTRTILPTGIADEDKVVTWTSRNTDVATVSESGVVEAKAKGTTIITVETTNGKTATIEVTVSDN